MAELDIRKAPTSFREICCNLCGNTPHRFRCTAVDRLHGFEGQYRYVTCERCGLMFMNPQISPDQIGRVYPSDYSPHQGNLEPLKDSVKRILPGSVRNILTAHSVILDIGCGNGSFLAQIRREFGCAIHGVDISTAAVEVAKKQFGLDIFCGQITDSPYSSDTFDMITAWSCIEHVPDPMEVARKAWSLCKPGGWFILKTPNSAGLAAILFKDKWYHLDCPRHLFLFNPKTISMLLERCGFVSIQVDFEASSKGWMSSLQYVAYGDNWRPQNRNRIRHSKIIKAIVSPIPRIEKWFGRTDILLVSAQKPL